MEMDGLPSVIRNNNFGDKRVITDSGVLLPAYIASQRGFSLDAIKGPKKQLGKFYERLRQETDIFPLCPFSACGEFLDVSELQNLNIIEEETDFWDKFNQNTGRVNYQELMPRSAMMVARINGTQIDDGVAGEIGFYSGKFGNPVFAILTDKRLSLGRILKYILENKGQQETIFQGEQPTDDFIKYFNRNGLGVFSYSPKDMIEENKQPLTLQGEFYSRGEFVPALILSNAGYDEDDKETLDSFCDDLSYEGIYPIPTFHNSKYDSFRSGNGKNHSDKISPGIIDNILMRESAFAISLLDGSHALDDELCAEMGLYCGKHEKPIIGVRSDLRLAENPAAPINPAIRYFMDQGPYEGQFIHGGNAYSDAIKAAKDLSQKILNNS